MKLIIVESPTKSKTLAKFLTSDYQILASMGHIRDLPKKKLAIDVDNNFQPDYVVLPEKRKVISQLRQAALRAQEIILATDPDREGEAIAYHVAYLLQKKLKKTTKIVRIVFHEITDQALKQALQKKGEINQKLVEAQQARRLLDRLAGYKLSPVLWIKIRRGLSAGRVQSPAVRLIVERERQIKAFVAQEYWEIEVELKSKKSQTFTAKLTKIDNKKAKINNKKQADKVIADLEKLKFQVLDIKISKINKSAPPPFITSTMQRTASSLLRWSAKKTMREAQRLYEHGFITYHRTDSVNLSLEAVEKARDYIKNHYGNQFIPEKIKRFKVKSKLAQEAHEAIRPVVLTKTVKTAADKVGYDASRLYSLIFKRFLASQIKDQVFKQDVVDIQAGNYLFRAMGQIEVFPGWKIVYQTVKNDKQEIILPDLVKNEIVDLIKILPEQKFTQPPSRYTEGSLIKVLEEKGIGRPSTYAPIISTVQQRQYVEKVDGFFQPTNVGETVNDFLVKYFSNFLDYDFTAKMEDDLDIIAQGKKDWTLVLKSFYQPLAKKISQVLKTAKRAKIKTETTGEKCPKCQQGDQVIRIGRFGKFLSCSRFPDCDWKAVYQEKIKGVKCPQDQGDILVRKTKKGKRFYGCSNWPKCKWASWRKPSIKS